MSYVDKLKHGNLGLPEVEARLLAGHTPGELEAYHVSIDQFANAISAILDVVPPGGREEIRRAIHNIIAGTAMYAYSVGISEGRDDPKSEEEQEQGENDE